MSAETNMEAAGVIAKAITEHYGGEVPVNSVLAGLVIIAADMIRQCNPEDREELLKAWDEVPSFVRSQVVGPH